GFTGLARHAGRPVPAVVTAALSYLVSQAETAIYCGLGMTSGAADVVERHAPVAVRDQLVARLTSLDPDEAWAGGMFLTERLEGARAWLAGNGRGGDQPIHVARDGRGLNRMMEMVNGSRFGVALMGLGIHRRSFLEAAIYAGRREAFGQRIDRYPLVRETLVDLVVELEGGVALTFECAAAGRST